MFGKKPSVICAFIGKPCIKERCAHWANVKGVDPQTGAMMDDWKCAFTHLPILMVEVGRQVRSFAAAVESHRNVAATGNQEMASFLNAFSQAFNHAVGQLRRLAALPHSPEPSSLPTKEPGNGE